MYLVVFPHGVLGYLIDLVRPPWGWSTGFLATPLTFDLNPIDLQYPDFVLLNCLLTFSAEGPIKTNEYTEKDLVAPEGISSRTV